MRALAVLLAAGQGTRLGHEVPKALVRLRGRTLLEWSADALAHCPEVAAIQIVVPPGFERESAGDARFLPPIAGGSRRQDSVARGLAAGMAARPDLDWVLVHDAARPCLGRAAACCCARSSLGRLDRLGTCVACQPAASGWTKWFV